jgi:deoxycytidylate deaminase
MMSMNADSIRKFIDLAFCVANEKSTCGRRKIGAVLLDKNQNVISVGYNSPPGEVGGECACEGRNIPAGSGGANGITSCHAIHAESMAIDGVPNRDEIFSCFSTKAPCLACVEKLLQTGCREIYFSIDSNDKTNRDAWYATGRKWTHIP